MKEIGEMLRSGREARGISLAEISEETKITTRHLEALEAGEFDRLPGDPYNKSFIRLYARAVRLDAEPIVRKYDQMRLLEAMADRKPKRERAAGRRLLSKLNQTLYWLGL